MLKKSASPSDSSKLTHPKYRADIDGLRAIAVLSVVAFHTFPVWVTGGFIGVDIFFVISGYLISTILFENMERGSFSFATFYARRIRRIFPSLLVVLSACFAFGWFALLPDEYSQLGKHMAGGAGFLSNFILIQENGYFDNASATKPLLHLWSLGIEEQFYIFWPLLLWLTFSRRLNVLTIIVLVTVASFVLNIWDIHTEDPIIAGYYSPQTRIWELAAGSVLAWMTLHKNGFAKKWEMKLDAWLGKLIYAQAPKSNGAILNNVLSLSGAFLVVLSVCNLSAESVYPGWWALMPVVGSILIISAETKAWVNHTLLSSRFLVWFGLISYPLYLWNWPLLSFAQIIHGALPMQDMRIILTAVSIALAWLTYVLVERPVRSNGHGKAKIFVLVVLMLCIASAGYVTHVKDGWELRQNLKTLSTNFQQLRWNQFKSDQCVRVMGKDSNYCLLYGNENNIEFVIVGDSTANALAPGFGEAYGNAQSGVVQVGTGTCPAIRGLKPSIRWGAKDAILAPDCVAIIENAYNFILNTPSVKTVLLPMFPHNLQQWSVPGVKENDIDKKFQVAMALFEKDIAALKGVGKKVVITYDGFYTKIDPRACLSRPFSMHQKPDCTDGHAMLVDEPNIALFDDHFKGRADICVFRQTSLLPHSAKIDLFDTDGTLLVRDDHHLSMRGSLLMAREFDKSDCSPDKP